MAVLRAARRKARAWSRRSAFERRWLGPVWVALGVGRLTVLTVPFRRLAPLLGRHVPHLGVVPLVSGDQQRRAAEIRRVVHLAARHTPWCSNCFPQAIAARLLLGIHRIPYALYFGVAKDGPSSINAHAWVYAGPVAVSGGNGFATHHVVGTFVSPGVAETLE